MKNSYQRRPKPGAANPSLETLAEEILRHDKFFMLLHLGPDGDSIGASVGLALALSHCGKEIQVAYVDYVPERYTYLEGAENICHWSQLGPEPGVALLCDCSNFSRVGKAEKLVKSAPVVFNIDHHADNTRFGDFSYVEPEAAAAGEIVYKLLPHLGVNLSPAIAEALYLAIVTDTGSFRYQNTTAATHRIAAELIDAGVDVGMVTSLVYENRPLSAFRVLARALSSLQRHDRLPVAWMVLTKRDLEETEARADDTDAVVNHARSLEGVEVAFVVREEPEEIKVSFRSQKVDVSQIAADFGGGGHPQAAGCRFLERTPEQVVDMVLAKLTSYLGESTEK